MTVSSLTEIAALAGLPAITADEAAERELIRAAQTGCESAFRELIERHQQRIYHFCFHYLRDAGDAREACQDTFIRAHRALASFKPKARLGTWLFQIALNLCRDQLKSGRAKQERLTDSEDACLREMACSRPSPDEVAVRHADLVKLDRGLAQLPPGLRDVLVLSCLEGLSHGECAVILKCSERAVEGRLYRAREKLAAWWERDGKS